MFNSQKDPIALLDKKIQDAIHLLNLLVDHSIEKKIQILRSLSSCERFLQKNPRFEKIVQSFKLEEQYLLFILLALGQEHTVFQKAELVDKEVISQLILHLSENEKFYEFLGGILGYHIKCLQLMKNELEKRDAFENQKFCAPPNIDMRNDEESAFKSALDGLRLFEQVGEIYVVGGAGDRLHLQSEDNKRPLPAACLGFCNKTLFEWLISDLEAREYLYYKLFSRKITTPILLMTSKEKMNDKEIEAICESHFWFGRPKESFFLLVQPLAPVIDIEGDWVVSKPFELFLKPGGHGVIWKLAKDQHGFDFFRKKKREYVLIRQINNPLSGQDTTLLSLIGVGTRNKKVFGIIACPRMKHASEGMIVLLETKKGTTCTYAMTNVEYTEISKVKAELYEAEKETEESTFPGNTNILFANIDSIEEASKKLPFPGAIVNMKQNVHANKNGQMLTLQGARLESTMQNISDALPVESVQKVPPERELMTFVLLCSRNKTISVAKKAFDPASPKETPESCFYDLITCNLDMLKKFCKFSMDPLCSFDEYLKNGPSMIFLYHPTLGPLYSIIGQKISRGRLHHGAELVLDISHIHIANLDITGSCVIRAKCIVSSSDSKTGHSEYSDLVGKVELLNVKVKNKGLSARTKEYWKKEPERLESCTIHLQGNSQFYAENVTFEGNFTISVPDGMKAYATQMTNGKIHIEMKPLAKENDWKWVYELKDEKAIVLKKEGKALF